MLNLDDLKEIIKVFKESDLTALEYEKDNFRVKVEKRIPPFMPQMAIQNQPKIENENKEKDIVVDNSSYVVSPLVGVFHTSQTPGGEPIVKVGSKVKKGDKLCIIEAMKVMNEITSDYDGIIKEILVKDGESVDFGKKLFLIGE